MKKLMLCICAYLIVAISYKAVTAGETGSMNDDARVEGYIASVYRQIDFTNSERLSYEVFSKAYHGYLNLKNAGKLSNDKDIITICNFSLPSTENRMWIVDLRNRKILFNTYVAHGQGSGEDCSMSFSNSENSHQSSLGFYVTGDTYEGEHGTSLHLQGLDNGFNDAAYDRGIVVHGADYVSEQFINGNGRLGRSWGCPAVSPVLSLPIINTIKDGTCLFIYYPDRKYAATAYWLNKKITLPENSLYADMMPQQAFHPKYKIVEYRHGNVLDSVKKVLLQ